MRRTIVALAAALASAATAAVQTPTGAEARAKPTAAAGKPVCRLYQTTGSIMPGKRVCHTAAEWSAIDGAQAGATRAFQDRMRSGTGADSRGS